MLYCCGGGIIKVLLATSTIQTVQGLWKGWTWVWVFVDTRLKLVRVLEGADQSFISNMEKRKRVFRCLGVTVIGQHIP